MGHIFLVVVDAHSRWPEILKMEHITTNVTMDALTKLFSRYGICGTLVSDNNATTVSKKFQKFLKINGIVHKITSVYKPSTNGLAERMVQLFEASFKTQRHDPCTIHKKTREISINVSIYCKHNNTGKTFNIVLKMQHQNQI